MKLKWKDEPDGAEDEEMDLAYDEIKERKKELRKLKLEREMLKMKADVERLRQEIQQYGGDNPAKMTSKKGELIGGLLASLVASGIPPEKADEFLKSLSPEAVATLSAITQDNPWAPVLMFYAAMGRSGGAQSLTPKDVVEINKATYELAEKLGGGSKSMDRLIEALTTLYGKLVSDKIDKLADAVIAQKKSALEEILEDEKKLRLLRDLFGGSSADPRIQIELEKLRQEHELRMKQLELEMKKFEADVLKEKQRQATFAAGLRKIGEAIASGISEAQITPSTGLTYRPTQPKSEAEKVVVKCSECGADMVISPGEAEVKCPKCGAEYEVKPVE